MKRNYKIKRKLDEEDREKREIWGESERVRRTKRAKKREKKRCLKNKC